MLDIKRITDNPEQMARLLSKRGFKYGELVVELSSSYNKLKQLISRSETLMADRNSISKNIGLLMREGKKEEAMQAREKVANLKAEIASLSEEKDKLSDQIQNVLQSIPNTLESAVPEGENEDQNVEISKWSNPTQFDFTPKPHWDLVTDLDIVDFERSTKVTGSRFITYKRSGAKLIRALQNYMLDFHIANGAQELMPPVIVNSNALFGTGQLPKFEEDLFKLSTDSEYYLSPTAEVQVTNYHNNEILDGDQLPKKFCASTLCFRSEAGSAGRDTRGLIRLHQFYKIEMVRLVKPEDSQKHHEEITSDAAKILENLGLPYRKLLLCAGDTGFSSQKTYDLEVWLPSYNNYKEISSCSNFGDYQARRAKIRFKRNKDSKAELVHTLNGSGLAVDRTFAAIIENYQNKDGSITVPEVLVPYMGGQKLIK